MSATPPPEGWWLASDGRWYPPELHPGPTPTPTPTPTPAPAPAPVPVITTRRFRSRPVVASGAVLVGLGLILGGAAVGLALRVGRPDGLPLGLLLGLIGVYFAFSGAGRMAAWLEVSQGAIRWTWSFSRHELRVTDLVDAALVEKGAPAPGGEWAGFIGGGFAGVIAWWLLGLGHSVLQTSPTMGSRVLMILRVHSEPVHIPVIGTWGTAASHTEAALALTAVQEAIRAGQVRATGRPRSS